MRQLLRPLLTSACPSRRLATPLTFTEACRSLGVRLDDLRSIHPPHLRRRVPCDIGLRVLWPSRPRAVASRGSCSSDRSFAYSFFQTPPRGGSPCCSARGSRHKSPQRTYTSKSSIHARHTKEHGRELHPGRASDSRLHADKRSGADQALRRRRPRSPRPPRVRRPRLAGSGTAEAVNVTSLPVPPA